MSEHRTAPVPSDKMPSGIPYIVGNEAAERFSYYGMKAILVVFMTKYMVDSNGNPDVMSPEEAKTYYHLFGSAVYFFPILGALIADALFGKYKTILSLSVVYCLGHLALALDETRMGLFLGLSLIALGSGGIKPCVSAHVGDQFGKTNAHLLEQVFGWFYLAINLGAVLSTLATPYLLQAYGPHLAFGLPGLLMMIATIVFWMGRNVFVHIPPHGTAFVKETFSGEGLKAIGQLVVVYLFVAMFWALFDQTGSAWVLQADQMDREFLGITWLPSQIQAINPAMILLFVPTFTFLIYPAISKVFPLTPLRKISIGFFVTVPAFLLPAWIQTQIEAGLEPNIVWQLLSYAIITAAEVFVSITALEFSYTQAPNKMKSLVMGLFLMSVSLGNIFTAGVNAFIQEEAEVAKVAAKGTQSVKPEKPTTYAITCGAGEGAQSATVRVEALPPNQKKKDTKKKEAPTVSVTSFAIKGSNIVKPNTEVEVSWDSTGADECTLSPPGAKVEGKGTSKLKTEATRTYTLACKKGEAEVSKTVKIVTSDIAIASFTVDVPKVKAYGDAVNLAWDVRGTDKCTISARTSTLSAPGYYMFFAIAMLITAVLFVFVAMWFKPQTYVQEEQA